MSDEREPDATSPAARHRLARVWTARPAPPAAVPAAGAGSLRPVGGPRWSGRTAATGDPHRGGPGRLGGGAFDAGRLGGGAFDPGRPGLRALAVLAAVVVLGAGVVAWWSRPRAEPVPPPLSVAGTAAPSPTAPAALVVAVSGEVREPGLVELPPGSRVADAIEAAGGLLPDADVDHLNLARKVTDGELIPVGIPPPPGAPAGSPGGAPGPGAKVNLNTATLPELETLPGIGPALAQRIVDYRTAHGPFTSVGELRQVSGIGEVRFAELKDLVVV